MNGMPIRYSQFYRSGAGKRGFTHPAFADEEHIPRCWFNHDRVFWLYIVDTTSKGYLMRAHAVSIGRCLSELV